MSVFSAAQWSDMFNSLFGRQPRDYAPGDLFIRARPRQIKVTETYCYKMYLSGFSQLRESREPAGRIELAVPYDGGDYVTADARRDVQKAIEQLQRRPGASATARMGYLVFANHSQTDLDTRALAQLRNNALPLDLPVHGAQLRQLSNLAGRGHVAVFTQEYVPHSPGSPPLEIKLMVTDNGREVTASEERRPASLTTAFSSALLLQFQLELRLPAGMDGRPRLKRMTITWPPTASYRRLHLALDGEPAPLWIEPASGTLAWGGFEFAEVTAANEDTDQPAKERSYRLPPLTLFAEEPGELLHALPLQGEVEIELPDLLSGLQLHLFDATGLHQEGVSLNLSTRLKVAVEFDVAGCFAYRSLSPSLQLVLPGVIFDDHRLAEVRRLLDAEGFVDIEVEETAVSELQVAYFLTARRMESAGELFLAMGIEANSLEPAQERPASGQPYLTLLSPGDTMIYMRVDLVGDRWRPAQVLNRLHRLLKKRFSHLFMVG